MTPRTSAGGGALASARPRSPLIVLILPRHSPLAFRLVEDSKWKTPKQAALTEGTHDHDTPKEPT